MKFLIIIPAHNEAKFITSNLESLRLQQWADFKCIIVNDGSTDQSQHLIQKFISKYPQDQRFQLINLEKSRHEPGAKVVRTFYNGLKMCDLNHFDVICKFDADIIFPPTYLSQISAAYRGNSKAGMVSGLVYISENPQAGEDIFSFDNENEIWQFENLSSKKHVRGPIKSYRKACFLDMKGLRSVLGWDNIDVMLAQKMKWEVLTIPGLWVKHLRPTAFEYKSKKAAKLGEYFYNIGLSFPLMLISSLKSSLKNKSLTEFFTTVFAFLKQNGERSLSQEEIQYIRNLRWKQIFRLK